MEPSFASALGPVARSWLGRGGVLRRGESLTSPSGACRLTNEGGQVVLSAWGRPEPIWVFPVWDAGCLALGLDGDLTVWSRYRGRMWSSGTARSAAESLEVRDSGEAVLLDGDGAVIWTTGQDDGAGAALRRPMSAVRPPRPGPPPWAAPPSMPDQVELAAWIDSLVGTRGYCATVVHDLRPAEALERLGLPRADVARGTWAQLQDRRSARPAGADDVIVAAVALGPHTLVLADDRRAGTPGPALSAGTTAVTTCQSAGTVDIDTASQSDFLIQRDGAVIVQLREQPPRRQGSREPLLREALAAINAFDDIVSIRISDLALMCRVAGVAPAPADLAGELLGGITARAPTAGPGAVADSPAPARSGAAAGGRPPVNLSDYDEYSALVIRTDYSDEAAWQRVVALLARPAAGFELTCHFVDDPAWSGADIAAVLAALPESAPEAVYLADADTMHGEHALLAVHTSVVYGLDGEDYDESDGVTLRFRLTPAALGEVNTNISVANTDFYEFTEQAETERDAVYRWSSGPHQQSRGD